MLFCFLFLGLIFKINLHKTKQTTLGHSSYNQRIFIGNQELHVKIANDNEERALGLSGSKEIKDDQGMLFIFDNEQVVSFWMKDMNYPIDIIWINKDKQIIGLKETDSP